MACSVLTRGGVLALYFVQEVTAETAGQYAEEIGAMYLETSAKDDTNVHDIFVQLSTCNFHLRFCRPCIHLLNLHVFSPM